MRSFRAGYRVTAAQRLCSASRRGRVRATSQAMITDKTHALAQCDHAKQVQLALSAVRVASLACMKVQSALQFGDVQSKQDGSPVTVADYAAQAIVAWVLQQDSSDRFVLPRPSEFALSYPNCSANLENRLHARA
jgi:hypothetical protein